MPSGGSLDPERLGRALNGPIALLTPVGGGDICLAYRATTDDGRTVFVKTRADAPPGFFASEAAGLRRLGDVVHGVPVPAVLATDETLLVLEWVPPGAPSAPAAERFGRALAATHRRDYGLFGLEVGDGWIGTLQSPGGPWPGWPQMWAEGRIEPFLRAALEKGSIGPEDAVDVSRVLDALPDLAGPASPPSLIHGDLWAGNVIWGADGHNRLVDPAAHGGHRETDLAMLALFGLPHLERVLSAYHEAWPLADGWRERIPLHQLHPVLVHAVLFGGSYGARAGELARQALRAG